MFASLLAQIAAGWLLASNLFLFPVATHPVSNATPGAPKRVNPAELGIVTTARAVLVRDAQSGAVLYRTGGEAQLPLASLTKLMTALVWLDAGLDQDQVITIQADDVRDGNIVYLRPGDQVRSGDVLTLMLVASSNEAAAALARHTDPTGFVSRMNAKAQALGMTRTFFQEPTGLDPHNVATTNDALRLLDAALARPQIAERTKNETVSIRTLAGRTIQAATTNQLLASFLNQGTLAVRGAKTGHLEEVGYNLATVIASTSPTGPGLELVLLGAATPTHRWQEAKGLVDWVLRNYEWPQQSP